MTVATSPRPKPEAIPDHPGVYLFRDRNGRVIYVGKATSLRKRTASYFQPMRNLHPRTAAMVEASWVLEWVLVRSEVEALQLEYNLIKQHRPRYNVRYRDDKSYPWLAVPLADEIPRPRVERGPKRKGTRYFGPYAHAYAIRETLDLLLRTFPMRTCSKGVFDRHRRLGRPCILYDINKCSAPCVGHISPEGHRRIVEDFVAFMDGHTRPTLQRLEVEMRQAAEQLNFELAARLRDQLASVRKAMERQQMVSSTPEDFDIAAFAEDDLEAAVQVFFVRRGRVVGRRGFVVDKVEALDTPALAATFVQQLYGDRNDDIPREVLLPVVPDDADALRAWLAELRGGPVDFRVPRRGEKRALLETVAHNAREAFATHKLKRASDFDARARGLKELQEALDLPEAPLRIECYDISNLQGNQVVGSMVVFEDGLPRKSEYRRFEIRSVEGQDDVASLREVLTRRLARLASERDQPEPEGSGEPQGGAPVDRDSGRRRKFAYPPNLIVIDGGRPQLSAAVEAVRDSASPDLPVVSLAKRMEEVYVPGTPDPVVIPRTSEALYLLQRVRDEAHRFAITYHRKLRDRSMTRSVLDGIPGVGETRRRQLVRHFGSARKVAQASLEELEQVPGVGPQLAKVVHDHLHGAAGGVTRE
ncbi:MAG TPA: excinuclease ABC subunit UvrC [Actinomycetes bacterium]|nr:excinuclease ABC subunit UvrC [Actinomycetes bacterium]HEX2155414.1 excinuclease ABC subunit UvrC [Actinomycetes bacterium]